MNDTRFIELSARERAKGLLDAGTFRELLGPFDFIMSPWLPPQGIVPQADDGMVVAKGTIDGKPAVVIAIEGTFQGGSMGEVSGAKMAAALEMAAEDNRKGIPTQADPLSGNRRRPPSGSQSGAGGHRRHPCRHRRFAPLCPGHRHHRRNRRLLRRHVDCGGALQLPDRHPRSPARSEWPASHRTGSRHRGIRLAQPSLHLEPDRRRGTLPYRIRRCARR